MHDSTRSVQKKKEQLNASKRLLEEQEDEIMVNVGIFCGISISCVQNRFFFDPTVAMFRLQDSMKLKFIPAI
jgi:hypothetical protein